MEKKTQIGKDKQNNQCFKKYSHVLPFPLASAANPLCCKGGPPEQLSINQRYCIFHETKIINKIIKYFNETFH